MNSSHRPLKVPSGVQFAETGASSPLGQALDRRRAMRGGGAWRRAPRVLPAMLAVAQMIPGAGAAEEESEQPEEQMPRFVQTDSLADRPYTLKSGDFRLLLSPSVGLEWNDNINTSQDDARSDLIVQPLLQIEASYPITRNNLLRLDVGVGYDQYLENSELSTWRLQSGSALSFDIWIKDFTINLHDRFSYVRDAARRGDVAGTAEQGNIENSAGIQVGWNLGDIVLGTGYDHLNHISTSEGYEYQDRASEIVTARAGFRVRPQLLVGVDGELSYNAYTVPVQNDSVGSAGGIFAEWATGQGFSVTPRFGYRVYDFRQTSDRIPATDQDGWYLDLTVRHQVRDAIGYSLSGGRELRLGTESESVEAWYVRPTVTWQMLERVSVSPSFFFEHGGQGGSQFAAASGETYDWLGGGLHVASQLTEKLGLALGYRFTTRTSDRQGRDYVQNMVTLSCSYMMR